VHTDRFFHLDLVDFNSEQFVREVVVGIEFVAVFDLFTLQRHTTNQASYYMMAYLVSNEGRRQLCSVTSRTCVVRRTYSNYGDRCFAAADPKLSNRIPADLRQVLLAFNDFGHHKGVLDWAVVNADTISIWQDNYVYANKDRQELQ